MKAIPNARSNAAEGVLPDSPKKLWRAMTQSALQTGFGPEDGAAREQRQLRVPEAFGRITDRLSLAPSFNL